MCEDSRTQFLFIRIYIGKMNHSQANTMLESIYNA